MTTDAPTDTPAPPIQTPPPDHFDWHTPEGQTGYSWAELQQLSLSLSQSTMVKSAYRRQPNNIVLIAVTGQELGWGVTTAMRFIHVIDGIPTVSPEGMLALIRRAGHSVSGESSTKHATIRGRRADNGDTMEVTFTAEDALRAKLSGKDNWQKYPEAMLWARALAMLARRLFSDVLLGVAYVPDEMGAVTDDRGNWIDATATETRPEPAAPVVDWQALHWDKGVEQFNAAVRDTKRMLNLLPEEVKAEVRELLGPPPPVQQYSLNAWATRHKAVVDAARELGIEAAFADTTPNLTAMDAPPVDIATVVPPAEAPAKPEVTTPAYTADDDAADAAWVQEALAADDTATQVSDFLDDEE